jgi:pimeloyl-ACP methyl ester carboxylesterase
MIEFGMAHLRPHASMRGAPEPAPLGRWPDVPAAYILCVEDRTFTRQWARRMSRNLLGVDAVELPGGHCPFLSRPAELSEKLIEIAAQSPRV